ncbi:MAG: choice-of-anchor D domain-containing protein, partial [Candidatus Acidiferrales bacterium]
AATCQVSVVFSPLAAGARTATLTISSNSSTGPLTVSLAGTAVAEAPPGATLLPSSITFPSQIVGTSGLPINVTLTNIGKATFSIISIVANPSDFGQINSCGSSLAAGATCSIGVFFDPTVSGARTGLLTITDGAVNSPQTVSLSGTGQDFSVAAATQPVATVKAGQAAVYMLTLAPDGGFSQPVTFTCTGAPAETACVVSPNPAVLSGSSATATVTVTTNAGSQLAIRRPSSGPRPKPFDFSPGRIASLCSVLLFLFASLLLLSHRPRARFDFSFGPFTAALLISTTLFALSACSGGGTAGMAPAQPRTTAGTYLLTVTAASTSGSTTLTHQTSLTLVVQ